MDMVKSQSNMNPLSVLNVKEHQHANQKSISQRKSESIKSEHQHPQAVMSVWNIPILTIWERKEILQKVKICYSPHRKKQKPDATNLTRRSGIMATDRQTPCLYYVCAGLCAKGRKADHAHYCQHCNKYKPRARVKYKNQKKEKLEKIRKNERH